MKKLLFLLLLPLAAFAQNTKIVPACAIPFSFTTTGTTTNLTCGAPNGKQNGNGVSFWILDYYSTGFSGLSLVVQSAPDNAGAPGSWGTFGGTVLTSSQLPGSTGINPNTATTSAFTGFAGYFPWMRVELASITGTGRVSGTLYGYYESPFAGAGGGGSGCTSPCPVEGTAASGSAPVGPPVLVGGSDGTDVRTLKTDSSGQLKVVSSSTATSNTTVAVTSSGLTQILAASGSTVITVYHISVGFASGVNFQLESGTGSNCGTSTAAVTGVYQAVAGIALDVPFSLPAGTALCINLGSSVTGGGLLIYSQQ